MTAPRPARRQVLVAATRGLAGLALGAPVLTGCTVGDPAPPPPPDPLAAVADRAASDARLAEAVAGAVAAAHPALADAARGVAADRREHEAVLRAELRRARPAASTAPAPASAAAVPGPPDPAAARTALADALRTAQDEATALVGPTPPYRAGLLASIAACCASHQAVLP